MKREKKLDPRNCLECHKKFQPKRKNKIYCSQKCGALSFRKAHREEARARTKAWKAAHKKTAPLRECLLCKKSFQTARLKIFCGLKCSRYYKYHFVPKYKENSRSYGQKNAKKIRARGRKRLFANREKIYAYNNLRRRNLRLTKPWIMLLESAKNRAAKRKVDFNLTPEWALSNWTGRCAVSNIPFRLERASKGPSPFAPSIDRIDSAGGYTQDNCRFVLVAINSLKNISSDEHVVQIAGAIVTQAFGALQPSIFLNLPG